MSKFLTPTHKSIFDELKKNEIILSWESNQSVTASIGKVTLTIYFEGNWIKIPNGINYVRIKKDSKDYLKKIVKAVKEYVNLKNKENEIEENFVNHFYKLGFNIRLNDGKGLKWKMDIDENTHLNFSKSFNGSYAVGACRQNINLEQLKTIMEFFLDLDHLD